MGAATPGGATVATSEAATAEEKVRPSAPNLGKSHVFFHGFSWFFMVFHHSKLGELVSNHATDV